MPFATEAVVLGLSTGPACVAFCGPVLAPLLAAEGRTLRGASARLAAFLGGRLVGYLMFAAAAWALGAAIPLHPGPRALLSGAMHLLIAGMLAFAALPRRKPAPCAHGCAGCPHEAGERFRTAGPALLGLATGINLCPPFVAAALRASESGSLAGALLFFTLFFAGTSVWFVPAAGLGLLGKLGPAVTIARIAMAVMAAWYAYLGLFGILGGLIHA